MQENKIITAVKLKIDFEKPEDKEEMNRYFEQYANVATFAAKKIILLRNNFKTLPHKKSEDGSFIPQVTEKCSACGQIKALIKENIKNGERFCKDCFSKEGLSDMMIRKKLMPRANSRMGEPPRKVEPALNIKNAGVVSSTTYHLAIRDALNTIKAMREQIAKKKRLLKRDKDRLKRFIEIRDSENKRYQLPMKERQRSARFVHVDDKEKNLRGWTMSAVNGKIKILERNILRTEKSMSKPNPIKFKGSKIALHNNVIFDVPNNKVKIPLYASKWYRFYGSNVHNAHGKKFLSEKISKITPKKYGSLVRKLIRKTKNPMLNDYEFYIQYPIEESISLQQMQNVMGVDVGLNKLFAISIFHPNEKKPFFVRIITDEALGMRISRRRQAYGFRFKHNKRQKLKRMRDIEQKIKQYYHTKTKEIVNWAQEHNAVIVMENLEDMKKKSRMGERKENRYKISQFVYKTLRSLIDYKAAIKGIPVILVPPEGTSYTCSKCGSVDTQRPKQAIFKCNNPQCELNAGGKNRAINADYNASCNIAKKGLNSPEIKQYLEHF